MNIDNNSFDLMQPSPVPILFIPFKNNEYECNNCGNLYSKTLKFEQKYCKNCLLKYKYTTGSNTYLDVHIIMTNNAQCIEHKATRNNFCTINIQEWCKYCSEISYFRQVFSDYLSFINTKPFNYEVCDKHLSKRGPQYYQLSFGWVESTILSKKSVLIIYLPWWDNHDRCSICPRELDYIQQESKFHCQKWCSHCFIIYIGCSYCLTTNIIIGITNQSQCKNCKRVSFLNIDISGNCIIDEFLFSIKIENKNHHFIADYVNKDPFNVYRFIRSKFYSGINSIIWIPYSQIRNLKKIAEGGFSVIYKATWSVSSYPYFIDVAVKKLINSQDISKDVLNELKSLYQCNDGNNWIIGCYGITQDP
ncbi:hypothetical protein RirG_246020 [Rhizophagus irregularis DAOM 197198w]|uniref:Protein kinase domain-containing protein n=1 Tax=Rhizophagus irregularis (strain DAOM 197198w) TaxID=1432141 RepID=A0A015K1D1_RHIIW|nr:hypothetical protein RirG_246020 [Rhizophagus irregularis DAOM 197198w]